MNKIRRNDLCPCGSGRKFKNCCSRKTVQQTELLPTTNIQRPISASALANFDLGNKLAAQGKLAEAVSALRTAIAIQPSAAFIHSNLGSILDRMGRFDEAIEAYRRALSIEPQLAEVHSNLGLTLQAMGKLDAAVQSYRAALSIKPNFAAAHFNLGLSLQKQGEDEAAAESYRRMLALQPDHAQAHSNLGAALESQGKAEEAVNSYHRALDCDPTLLAARNGLDRTLSKLVPQWHLPMMNDSKRNDAYFAALRAAVTPHSTVLEIGTGSGLLSMMAAKLGAAEVTTCEAEPIIASTAKRIIADNGFDQRIKVIDKKSTDVMLGTDLTQPADIFVHEIFSSELLAESVLSTIEDAKRRLLKQDCRMIPAAAGIIIALFGGEDVGTNLMVEEVCGFDLRRFNTIVPKRQVVARKDLNIQFLSEDVEAFQFHFESESIWHPDAKTLRIQIKTTARCLGIIQWIRLYMDRNTVFENHPSDRVPATSWPPCTYLFPSPISVRPGQIALVSAAHNKVYPWFSLQGIE